eukprot:730512-Rhodomonas_salina.1
MPYVSQGIPTPYRLPAPCAIHSTSIVLTPCIVHAPELQEVQLASAGVDRVDSQLKTQAFKSTQCCCV